MENLFKKICRLAGETVVKYHLIEDGDRILTGLSGGKDSMVMMCVLEHLQHHAPVRFEFEAATFDPGFPEFATSEISGFCRERNWKHHTIQLPVKKIIEEKNFTRSPCVLCSRLRRGKLYGLAKKLNCNKLALGQHLDDVISSMLISLCRGQGISSMAPKVTPDNPEYPEIIRPLALVPERLIEHFAATLALPRAGICRYKEQLENGDRIYFRELISHLSERIPDLHSNIAHSLSRVELKHLLLLPEDMDGEKSK